MQGTRVQSLVWEDPTCHGATKPMYHNYWACTLEPTSHNFWAHVPQLLKPSCSRACVLQLLSLCTATTEAHTPRAHASQQEKPPQWEARALQWRVSPLTATRESPCTAMKTWRSQKKSLFRGPEQAFFQRRDTDNQQAHEKMLNINNHKENANQNHNKIPPHTCQNHQQNTNNKCLQGCGEKETLLHCFGIIN